MAISQRRKRGHGRGHVALLDLRVRRLAALEQRVAAESDDDAHEVLITHAYPIAWLIRHALDAPAVRWLGLSSANAALTVIENRPALPPSITMFNDMSHLRPDLHWTGFPKTLRP